MESAPSRLSSMMSLSPSFASQTMHCIDARVSVSVHVLHVTWPQGFATVQKKKMDTRVTNFIEVNARNISKLFDNVFLQQGQIESSLSFFAFAVASLPSEVGRGASDEDANENETGIRFFKLEGK
jgi:hypothetical protein